MTHKEKQLAWNRLIQHFRQNEHFVEFDGYLTTVIKQLDHKTYSFEIFNGNTTEGKPLENYTMSKPQDIIDCINSLSQHRIIAKVIQKNLAGSDEIITFESPI